MSSSVHRLSLSARRTPVETTTYPFDQLEEAYLTHHRSLGRSPKSLSHHRDTFILWRRFLADTGRPADSSALTTEAAQSFAAWLRETPLGRSWRGSTQRSVSGVHGALKDLKAFVRWLVEEDYLTRTVKVPVPKLPETLFPVLSETDMDRLWTSRRLTAPGPQGVRNRALLALMFDTGVRVSEVAGIELGHLDMDNHLVMVTGKGSKQRRVPFSTGVAGLLSAWLKVRGDEPGTLFWLKPHGVQVLFRRIKDETGLEVFHPHQCRHQAATMLVRANADLHAVKRILGHSHISVTERYLSLSDDDLRAKHAAASPYETIRAQLQSAEKPKARRLSLR